VQLGADERQPLLEPRALDPGSGASCGKRPATYWSTAEFSVSSAPSSVASTGTCPIGLIFRKSEPSATRLARVSTRVYSASAPTSYSEMRVASEQASGEK
jgi:hypothetical protein